MPPIARDQLVGQTEGCFLQQNIARLAAAAHIDQHVIIFVQLTFAGLHQSDCIAKDHAEQADTFALHSDQGIIGDAGQKAQLAANHIERRPFFYHGVGGALGDKQAQVVTVRVMLKRLAEAGRFAFVKLDRFAYPGPVGDGVVVECHLSQGGAGNGIAGIALVEDAAQLAVPLKERDGQQVVVIQQHGRRERQHHPGQACFGSNSQLGQFLFGTIMPALVCLGRGQQFLAQGEVFVDAGIDQGQVIAGKRLTLVQLLLDISADFDGLGPQAQGPLRQGAELLCFPLQRDFQHFPSGSVNGRQMLFAGIGGECRQCHCEDDEYDKELGCAFHERDSLT